MELQIMLSTSELLSEIPVGTLSKINMLQHVTQGFLSVDVYVNTPTFTRVVGAREYW